MLVLASGAQASTAGNPIHKKERENGQRAASSLCYVWIHYRVFLFSPDCAISCCIASSNGRKERISQIGHIQLNTFELLNICSFHRKT